MTSECRPHVDIRSTFIHNLDSQTLSQIGKILYIKVWFWGGSARGGGGGVGRVLSMNG